MKKISKKRILFLMLAVILLTIGVAGIYAASKYYQYKWTNEVTDVWEHNEFVTNDIIELEDGTFASVGFNVLNNYMYGGEKSRTFAIPSVRHLNSDGSLIKEMIFDSVVEGQMKYIKKVEGGFLAFCLGGSDNDTLVIYKITNDFEIIDIHYQNEGDWGGYHWSNQNGIENIYLVEDENYYYCFSVENTYSEFENAKIGQVLKISKDINSEEINFITEDNYDLSLEELLKPYVKIRNYYSYDNLSEYSPIFIKKYKEGYIYGLQYYTEEHEYNNTLLVYTKADEEVWGKKYDGKFIIDGTEVSDKFVLGLQEEKGGSLLIIDEEGNELSKEPLSNYLSNVSNTFAIEHIIYVGTNNFAVTGTEYLVDTDEEINDAGSSNGALGNDEVPEKPDGIVVTNSEGVPLLPDGSEPPDGASEMDMGGINKDTVLVDSQYNSNNENENTPKYIAEILYFNIIHNIYVNTSGKGTVEVSHKEAGWGDEVTFTITPEEGYVLGVVKVTDSNENTITFTDYQFTMPDADVTIEVTFVVENPETYAFISIVVVAALGGSSYWLITNRKKKLI